MFFDDLTDGSGLFDIGGDIWQITPDGLGGFIAMPFDPVADLAAGLLMPVILALPIIGILMVGQPLVIALAAAAVGFVIAMLLSALLHPIAGYGVFATCLTYLFGTLSWAVCDKFETHNPIFLFGYIGIAALVLIAWALLGSGVEEITDDVIPSLLGIGTAIGGFITSAMLFFTALGENRAKYSVYAFRIMHYLLGLFEKGAARFRLARCSDLSSRLHSASFPWWPPASSARQAASSHARCSWGCTLPSWP